MDVRFDNAAIELGKFRLTADIEIKSGSRVAILGPSGGGKSTLLSAIAGFIPLQSGSLSIGGTDQDNLPPGKRPVTLLFQDNNLFPHLTAMENVGLGLKPNLRLTSKDKQKVEASLERVGLAGLSARHPADLSGGQQSRVALARALLRDKPVLLLDEPFAALGPALKAEMLDLVAEITAQTSATLLMVTHAPEDARRITDQTVLVAENLAHPPMDTTELLDNPPNALAAYLGR